MRAFEALSLIMFLLLVLKVPIAHCQASQTISQDVLDSAQANVIYTDIGGGFVEISFIGEFDFSLIGGSIENFSGTCTYHDSEPPVFTDYSHPQVKIAIYNASPCQFTIFGDSIIPNFGDIYVHDGSGNYNDGFYFCVHLDYSSGDGIRIPNTTYGLIKMGVNAGAYPGNVLTSTEVPKNLNTFNSATPNPPNLYAVVKASYPDDPPEENSNGCFIDAAGNYFSVAWNSLLSGQGK